MTIESNDSMMNKSGYHILVLNMNYLPWNKFLVDATLATVCATSGSNLPKKSTVRVGMCQAITNAPVSYEK